jgi:hypothetical protein
MQVLAHGGGDEVLLLSMADDISTFKPLLDTCPGVLGNSRVAKRRQ